MTFRRVISAASLFAVVACGPDDVLPLTSAEIEKIRIGDNTYSIPIGSDGFVNRDDNGNYANWGANSRLWRELFAAKGVEMKGNAPFEISGRTEVLAGEAFSGYEWAGALGPSRSSIGKTFDGLKWKTATPSAELRSPLFFITSDTADYYVACLRVNDRPRTQNCTMHVNDGVAIHSFPVSGSDLARVDDINRAFREIFVPRQS